MSTIETIKEQAKRLAEQMLTLTRDERLEVLEAFLRFCRFCGDDETVNGPCHCMNDE